MLVLASGPTYSSTIARIRLQTLIPSPARRITLPLISKNVKIAIKAKHEEWLDANKTAHTCKADAVEEKLGTWGLEKTGYESWHL
jgi:hypothetical protein